jgi:hypothetical protein
MKILLSSLNIYTMVDSAFVLVVIELPNPENYLHVELATFTAGRQSQ